MLEMTIVAPFLIFLGLGVGEFGRALYHYHMITNGLRDAARYLARFDDPLAAASDGKAIAATGAIGGASNRVSWWNASDVSVAIIDVANPYDPTLGQRLYRGADPIKVVRVSTNVNHPGLGFLNILGISSPLPIRISHEERVIGE